MILYSQFRLQLNKITMTVKELKELIEYTFDDPKYNMNKPNEKLMIVKCLESEEY